MKLFTRMLAILAIASSLAFLPVKASEGPPSTKLPVTLSYQSEPPAPTTWSGAVYFDLKSKTSSAILTYPVTTFTRIFGTKLSLDLLSFAGVTIEEQPSGLAGFIIGKSGRIADQITGFVGLGFPVMGNVPKSLGIAAGISVKF
jgi:hypothetical protein